MKKNKLLILFLLLLFSATVFANSKKGLAVNMNDGTTEYFVLAENLEITFAGELMRVFSTSY